MRIDNPIYKRQENLNLRIPELVVICGCGGGFWDGVYLALAGVENFILFDDDKLDISNLNRIPCSPDDVGNYKVEILKDQILYMRPQAKVIALPVKATYETLKTSILEEESSSITFIDGTDNFEAQKDIKRFVDNLKRRERFFRKSIGYVRIGVNTNHFTVTHKLPPFDSGLEEKQQRCGITVPSWISPVVIASALGVAKILKYSDIDLSTNLDQLVTPNFKRIIRR